MDQNTEIVPLLWTTWIYWSSNSIARPARRAATAPRLRSGRNRRPPGFE